MRATPTPLPELSVRLADYVLPGGHYSPDVTGGEGAFNLDELPASIRPVAMAQLVAPQAERFTPQASSPVRIVINTPQVQVDASIYGGDDWYNLVKGVGHYLGSANPGESANMVLSAHNDIYGEIFRYIQYLEAGDEIDAQQLAFLDSLRRRGRPGDKSEQEPFPKSGPVLFDLIPEFLQSLLLAPFLRQF